MRKEPSAKPYNNDILKKKDEIITHLTARENNDMLSRIDPFFNSSSDSLHLP